MSVVVVSFDMERELPRTLLSLAPSYQRGLSASEYELVVVDNASPVPVSLTGADGLTLIRIEDGGVSPARAVNAGLAAARGDVVGVWVDGARLASPGLLAQALRAQDVSDRAVVVTPSFHLGPGLQRETMQQGYGVVAEDELLARIDWPRDGYRLFEVASLAGSSGRGVTALPAEANALFLPRGLWDELGGYDERFVSAGGGLVNLDILARACELPRVQVVSLLGEGTFHQIHGGVTTNNPGSRWDEFHAEYVTIRGHSYSEPGIEPLLLATPDPFAVSAAIGHGARARLDDPLVEGILRPLFEAIEPHAVVHVGPRDHLLRKAAKLTDACGARLDDVELGPLDVAHQAADVWLVEGDPEELALRESLRAAISSGTPPVIFCTGGALAEEPDNFSVLEVPAFGGLVVLVPDERLARSAKLRAAWAHCSSNQQLRTMMKQVEAEREALSRAQYEARELRPLRPMLSPARGRTFETDLPPRLLKTIQQGVYRMRYRNVSMYKNPFDVALFTRLWSLLKPRTVIEVGTKDGGSALWFADLMRAHRTEGAIISIDLTLPEDVSDPMIDFRRGDALTLQGVLSGEELAELPHPFLVVEDSAHFYETSRAVLDFFHPHLRPGDYMVIEDGSVSFFGTPEFQRYRDGPNRAVTDFLDAHPEEYEIDITLCDLFGRNVTANPNGWLTRTASTTHV